MARFSIGGSPAGGPWGPGSPGGPDGTCPKELTWAMEGVEEICWISMFLGTAWRLHKLCLEDIQLWFYSTICKMSTESSN